MTTEISRTATDIFERMRTTNPLVQCITNYVAMNYAANVLLAAGASPAMVHTPEESGEFATIASALTVNIGGTLPATKGNDFRCVTTNDGGVEFKKFCHGVAAIAGGKMRHRIKNPRFVRVIGGFGSGNHAFDPVG